MGRGDRARHKIEEAVGTVKRKVGKATGDTGLRAEGAMQETKAKAKQIGDDAAERARDLRADLKARMRRRNDRHER